MSSYLLNFFMLFIFFDEKILILLRIDWFIFYYGFLMNLVKNNVIVLKKNWVFRFKSF